MRVKPLIKNFLAGEIAPQLDGLLDAPVQGCRTLENFIVRKQGGIERRPGTVYAGAVKTASLYTRIIPFESTTGAHYVIELGNLYARFWIVATHLVAGGAGSETEVVTPFLTAQLRDIKYRVIKDSIYFTHPSHPVQRLTWTSSTSWLWEQAPLRVNSQIITAGDKLMSWATKKDEMSDPWTRISNLNFDLTNPGNILGIAWGNGTWIMAGAHGRISLSYDGEYWTPINIGTTDDLQDVIFGGNLFIALHDSSVYISTDGITWAAKSVGAAVWYCAAFKPNLHRYIVAGVGAAAQYSDDGHTWAATGATGFTADNIYGACYGNDRFVLVGAAGKISTSPDGKTWTTRTSGITNAIYAVKWIEELSLFVALGDGKIILTSSDAITWTIKNAIVLPEVNTWQSVCWSPALALFCAVSSDGTNRVMTSTDGKAWVSRTAAEANSWQSVCWSPALALFCAVSSDGTNRVMTSDDGITWTARTPAATSVWQSVCWSPALNLFCAVANDTANCITISSDGITWTTPSSINASWYSVCWSPALNLFCAVALNTVMTSPDGTTWSTRTPAETNTWQSVCWSPALALFCAVSSDGTNRVMTSDDGITWTARAAAEANAWQSVCWSPALALFCAVSSDGTNRVMTSSDGITWTTQTAAGANEWYGICWSPALNLFCAVSITGASRAMLSSDGILWRVPDKIYDITWDGCRAIACGSNGLIITSQDLITWTSHTIVENFIPTFRAITVDYLLDYPLERFNETDHYPRACAYHEGRLILVGTDDDVNKGWGSQINQVNSFHIGPFDDDAWEIVLGGPRQSRILWLVEAHVLILATDNHLGILIGGPAGITANNRRLQWFSTQGSADLQGILVGNRVLFAQRNATVVRAARYDVAGDDPDLTHFADHIAVGGIKEWDYQKTPESIIWAIRADGTLLSLSYDPSIGIIAWARHTSRTDDFESVAVVGGATEDEIWFVVERTNDQLIDRGDCESATSPMIFDETVPVTSDATWAKDNAQAYEGTNSYKFTKTIAAGTSAWVSLVDSEATDDMHGLVAGEEYTFTVRVYIPSGGILGIEAIITIDDYQVAWASSTQRAENVYDEWQEITITRTIRAAATGVKIRITTPPTSANNEYFYVDNIRLNPTGDSHNVRYLEYMDVRDFGDKEDAHFVDAGKEQTITGTAVSNLDHLEGETVDVLVDGNVVESHIVWSGTITLDASVTAKVVHVGLPYDSKLQTTRLRTGSPWGESAGLKKMIPKVFAWIYETIGGKFGPSETNTESRSYTSTSDLETDLIEVRLPSAYNDDGYIWVIQDDPLPMTLLALSPEVRIGDR